jgi:hypothetical protein
VGTWHSVRASEAEGERRLAGRQRGEGGCCPWKLVGLLRGRANNGPGVCSGRGCSTRRDGNGDG